MMRAPMTDERQLRWIKTRAPFTRGRVNGVFKHEQVLYSWDCEIALYPEAGITFACFLTFVIEAPGVSRLVDQKRWDGDPWCPGCANCTPGGWAHLRGLPVAALN